VGENTELVRQWYESYNRGEDIADFVAPDVEYVNPEYAIETGTRRGLDGWRQAFRRVRESFGAVEFEVERLVESGDRVAALGRFNVTGRGSGVANSVPQSHLWTIRDGKIVRFQWWNDPESALEALGGEREE
jgi:ketosteroid isomerase-like protein